MSRFIPLIVFIIIAIMLVGVGISVFSNFSNSDPEKIESKIELENELNLPDQINIK